MAARRYGTAHEPGKIKLEIGFYDGTLPRGRDHAVGVCVVEVVRANQCEKRQKPCSRRHGGFPHVAGCKYGTAHEPGKTKLEIGFYGGTLPKGRDHAVGVCVVEVVRPNQCEKRQKPCSRRHGGCPHMAACRYGTVDEPGEAKPEIGFYGGTLP